MSLANLTILGLGNELMGDDAVGIRLIRELADQPLPDNVDIVDGGAGGLNLLNVIERADYLLAVDAAEMNLTPGHFRWVNPDQLRTTQSPVYSLHDTSFANTLQLAEQFFKRPPAIIFAVQPASIEQRFGLSDTLESHIPTLIQALTDGLWQRHRKLTNPD